MPAPGDQHKQSWANPFEEAKPRISEWTAKEIATISSKLDKQLGPEYISSRSGPGGSKVHYLTAEKCIGLANQVFGFNGWSSSIQNIQVDFADENPQTQRVSIGLSVIVRITLRDGTYHEDIGYGSIENARGKAMAFEKAKKEGTTDGMKRALRSFGNVLGNCIYDQDYVKQVTKVKAQPIKKFDQDNLHRHADFVRNDLVKIETASNAAVAALKAEPGESFDDYLGELDEADFCVPEDGHPDEVILPNSAQPAQARVSNVKPQPHMQPPMRQSNGVALGENSTRQPQTPNAANSRPMAHQSRDSPSHAGQHPPQSGSLQIGNPSEPVAFFSARSVPKDPDSAVGLPKQLFDPKAESPSIRKTPGIDHNSSKPLARTGQHLPPASSQSATAPGPSTSSFTQVRPPAIGGPGSRGNVVNPSLDHARRIGAPNGPGSPLANRGSYKPPTMKRPLPGEANVANTPRSPLLDMPTNTTGQSDVASADGLDSKRQRMV